MTPSPPPPRMRTGQRGLSRSSITRDGIVPASAARPQGPRSAAEDVYVHQEAAAGDDPLPPAEEPAPRRAALHPAHSRDRHGGDPRGGAGGGGDRQRSDLAPPELDRPSLPEHRQGGARLDHRLSALQLLSHRN